MFGLAAFNRMLRKQQAAEEVQYRVEDAGLSARQVKAASKALGLLNLSDSQDNLQREDMMNFLYLVGMNPTPDVLDGKLRLLRLHKLQTFTWGQLAHVWSLLLRDAANEGQILERAFQFFDKDGNGEIDISELRTTMIELGNLLTEQEICDFISIMDVDGNGVIGYQEFLETLRTEIPEFAKFRSTNEEIQQQHVALADADCQLPQSEQTADAGQAAAQETAGTATPRRAQAVASRGGRVSRTSQRSSAALGDDEVCQDDLGQQRSTTAAAAAFEASRDEDQPAASLWHRLDADQPAEGSLSYEQPSASTPEHPSIPPSHQQQQQQQGLHARSLNRQVVSVQLLQSGQQQQATGRPLQTSDGILNLRDEEVKELHDALPGQL